MKKNIARQLAKLVLLVTFISNLLGNEFICEVIAEEQKSIKQVGLGGYHSAMLLEDGSLYLWGNNSEGQLGNATTKDTYIPQKILNHVCSVSLGNKHSAALLEDGSLWLWGSNDKGQLGDGTTADKSRPVKVLQDVKSVSLGYETSAALKIDGSLWMWGSNSGGQQGDNGLQFSTTPVCVNIQGLDSDIQEIYLGYAHCAALKEDGSLWMWGANNYGQLGNSTTTSVPGKAIKIMENVKCVSLGENHSAAVKNDGTLWMWGANSNAQLGDGSTTAKANPVLVLQNVRQVSLGYSHSVALQNDGYVWITGEGWESQIIGYPTIRPSEPVYVLSEVSAIFVGGKHNAALDAEDGSLWMWGNDQYGQSGAPAPSAQVGFPMFPGSSVIGKYMKQIYDGNGQFLYGANNAEYDIGYDIAAPADLNIKTDRIETTFSSSSSNIGNTTVSLKKGFDFVNTDSSRFNLDLALTAVTCSAQVYSNASGDHADIILQKLGYDGISLYKPEGLNGFRNPATCFGYKELGVGKNLFTAVVRGTDGFPDTLTDLNDGAFSMFSNTGDNIIKALHTFMEAATGQTLEEIKKEDNYFFFTGHSLGGAIANYLSIENTIQEFANYDKGKIYTYTFESPHTCINLLWMNPESMSNAFNYKVYGDAVTNLPNYPGSTTYGKDIIFRVSDLSNLTFKKLFVDSKESTLDDAVSVEGHGDIFGLHDICLGLIYLMGEYGEYDAPHFVSSGGGSGGWGDRGDDSSDASTSPAHNNHPGEYTSGDYTYRLSQSGDVEIIKYNGHDSTVTVPATLDGHPVMAIGDNAFFYHSGKYGINSITLPDSITSIGNYAFSDCYINSITLPSNLKKLGDGAFSSCWPLTSITLPDSITEIGANPFYDCLSLESIRVSSSHPTLATIDGVLFYKPEKRLVCYPVSIKNSSYTVPQGIRVIGDNAFCNNYLKSITLPDSVTVIGKEAFSACGNLITVTFSDSVTAIGDNAFPNSPYLTVTVSKESYGELYCKENHLSYKTYGSEATPTEDPISFHFKDDARQWYEPTVTFPVGYIEIYTNGNINDVKIVGCELSDESNIILAYYEEPANVEGDHLYHTFGISSIPDFQGIRYTLLPGANYKFREYVIYNGKKYYNGWIYFKMRDWLINGQ